MPKLVDHARRRDEVALLAQRVICESGLDNLTLRDVAALGGWSPSAVTHYFRSRDDLLLYTLHSSRQRAADRVEAAVAAGTSRLVAIIEQALPLDDERQRQWKVWLAFWGSAVGSAALAEAQTRAQERFRESIEDALRQADHTGDAEAESGRLVALVDGISIQATFAPAQWPADRQRSYFHPYLT